MKINEYLSKHKGQKENPSPFLSNPYIAKLIKWGRAMIGLSAPIDDGKWAWCALFVNDALKECGYIGTNSNRARSFLRLGRGIGGIFICDQWEEKNRDYLNRRIKAGEPIIAILKRGNNPELGHVTFVTALSASMFLGTGGNQNNQVKSTWYSLDDLVGVRIPVKI